MASFIGFTLTNICAASILLDPSGQANVEDPVQEGGSSPVTIKNIIDSKTLFYISIWSETVNTVLSYFIVIWRSWMLFRENPRWKWPIILTMVINIIECIYYGVPELNHPTAPGIFIVSVIALVISSATFKWAIGALNDLQQVSGATLHGSRALYLVLLTIECGPVLCIFQAFGSAAFGLDTSPGDFGSTLFLNISRYLFVLVLSLYPVVVFILIHTNNSPVNHTLNSIQSRNNADPVDSESITLAITNNITAPQHASTQVNGH
ncbi:hypothetical protein GYMLUDRAFT_250448 [Collybiopsis luxurians FD-317 M1]|uniref:Uncharacterized protein n=1 Tax=Collybiopsis luxurians FD-317 M1 TaxID=944289 RepID=A0A0D0BUT0_9AGAR|nr:hypothetical protein GYMLUDRAFT_250448 [Collybiopsis luxurians FD-317 M1]